MLTKYGIATACDVCFVETKRVNARDLTNGFVYEWESVRQALGINDNYYVSQQHQYEFSKEQKELIDRMASLDYIGDNGEIISATELEKIKASMSEDAYKKWKNNHKQVYQLAYEEIFGEGGRLEERARGKKKKDAIDRGITADKMRMIAKLISENSGMAGKFDPDALMNSDYTSAIVEKYYGSSILSALSSYAGAGTPKALLKARPYSERSWHDVFDKKNKKDDLIVKLFEIGGVRGQSFSDYDPFMVIDYLQKYLAEYLRGLPAHEYTKVPELIKTFGKTGVMFNMSLLPEVKLNFGSDVEMNKKYAGLQRATQEQIDAYNNSVKNGTVKEDLIAGKIVNVMTDEKGSWTYAWHRDSFPIEEAFNLRRNKEYGGRVGIIAVGTSSKQIRMMLDDPTIDMIIPYHSSGMPAHTKMTTRLDNATDYQKVQNTKKPKGVKADFSYNAALQELKDPRKAAQAYLDWCKEGNGKKKYTPKFKEFSNHENYYKFLEDFRGYDNDGNPVIQQAVDFSKWTDADWQEFAENAFLGIKKKEAENIQMNKAMSALETMPDAEGNVDENAEGNVVKRQEQLNMDFDEKAIAQAIKEEITEAVQFQRIDEANKSIIFAQLRKALGSKSVKLLPQDNFMSELFKIKGIDGDEQKIETFRKEKDGIIYGFAYKNQIYLNDNVFNAHAPVHEFTHIWAKVVQRINPDLWSEGVELLKQSKVWTEVVNDSNYYDIANDTNAIASEVLARIVGRKGESLIQAMLDPNTKLYTEKGKDKLLDKIMSWFEKFIGQVLETFGWKKGDALTLEEFVKLPVADLFNDKRAEEFKKKLEKAKLNEDLETEFMVRYNEEVKNDIARYQTGEERTPIKPYKRNPLKVLGQYEPTKKMITLFKGRNPTTLIHEMGHHYLPIQLRMLEKAGKWDKLKPLYKELGISSVEQMGRDAEEKLIDMFTSYIFYNEAPNVETQSIFERAKQWAINAYNTVKNYVKPSEEVTKFFDELIAGEETAPDISHLVGKEAELSKILQGARHGQELTINGLSMKDIAILRQALHARVPRRGRSLADVIRKAGGIDSRSEIAKALGYDSRKGGEMGFWNYRGTIDNEQALIELLVAEGFLFDVEQDSAEGVQAVWNKVERLINNRDTTFSEAEQMQNEKREQAYKVQEMVNNILVKHYNKDIKILEEDMKAVTKKLADIGAVAVDKATLEYLQNSLEKMSKDYRKLLSEKKEKQYKYQEELTKFIKSSPLNNKDKLKLIDKIRMVKDERTFEKYLGESKSQIEKYVEAESKRVLDELIQKEIKSSKPRKVMAQLYDYANNKLFADLREWNKLNQTEAEIKADQLDEAIAKGNGELSRTDKLRRMFLEYKSFGKDCSVEFMQALHDEIKAAKQTGIDAKDDADFMRAFEREQDREAILEKIKESNFDKNSFIGKVVNAYRNGISNLYSMLNSLVGKEIAEKFQFETIVENKQVKEWKHLKEVNQKAQKIYGVKSYGELLNLMADKGKKMFTIYKKKDTESFEGSLDDDFYHELSVLDLIDIYNSMKNIKTSDDYAKAYGIEQVNALLANLTEQDKAFADMLMEDVNSRYKAINKVYINLYGMDLKRVDNYWMSSTEHSTPIDVLNDMRMQSTTPGFFKERTSGSVIPLPKNAWLKYQNHIAQGYYMTEVAEKFKEMTEVFKSKRIENMITNKFGEKVYKTLIDQIEAIGLNASPASVDDMSKWYNKLVSNWVGAKIALNPVVFVGQLTSFTNYAVDVPTKAYLKNFMYALRHPKEVFDFMMKHNKDFLMHRYESGFNEAMSRFITQAESLNSMKFGLSPKSKFGWANILSSLVRMGDMGSLIFGGYGQFKTMLDNGMSVEEAKQKFEFATLRSQQSGNAASIAKIQRVPNGLSMLFLPFKNTAMQYGRKIVDTVVSYQNGDITKAQATKTLTNYLFIQPALWVFIRNIAKDILGLDDEDDEYTDGILEQILVNPIEMIPFAGESFKAAYSIIADEKLYGVYSMPLFDDIEKSWRKLAKEEKDIFDWVDIVSPVVEGLTATPIQTPKRYAQKWFGEE